VRTLFHSDFPNAAQPEPKGKSYTLETASAAR
jgi:hypothetical protein